MAAQLPVLMDAHVNDGSAAVVPLVSQSMFASSQETFSVLTSATSSGQQSTSTGSNMQQHLPSLLAKPRMPQQTQSGGHGTAQSRHGRWHGRDRDQLPGSRKQRGQHGQQLQQLEPQHQQQTQQRQQQRAVQVKHNQQQQQQQPLQQAMQPSVVQQPLAGQAQQPLPPAQQQQQPVQQAAQRLVVQEQQEQPAQLVPPPLQAQPPLLQGASPPPQKPPQPRLQALPPLLLQVDPPPPVQQQQPQQQQLKGAVTDLQKQLGELQQRLARVQLMVQERRAPPLPQPASPPATVAAAAAGGGASAAGAGAAAAAADGSAAAADGADLLARLHAVSRRGYKSAAICLFDLDAGCCSDGDYSSGVHVLLVREKHDQWGLPGGKVEPGDRAQGGAPATASREVEEETHGLLPASFTLPLLADADNFYSSVAYCQVFMLRLRRADTQRLLAAFDAAVAGGRPHPQAPRSSALGWWSLRQIMDNCKGRSQTSSPQLRRLMKIVLTGGRGLAAQLQRLAVEARGEQQQGLRPVLVPPQELVSSWQEAGAQVVGDAGAGDAVDVAAAGGGGSGADIASATSSSNNGSSHSSGISTDGVGSCGSGAAAASDADSSNHGSHADAATSTASHAHAAAIIASHANAAVSDADAAASDPVGSSSL